MISSRLNNLNLIFVVTINFYHLRCCEPALCGCSSVSPTFFQGEPIRVLVTGAAGQIAYSLLYSIAKGDVFGKEQVSVN